MQNNSSFGTVSLQNSNSIIESTSVRSVLVMVTITNDSIHGFQASTRVVPSNYVQNFSSLNDMTNFLLKIQNWEHMGIRKN